MSKFKVILAMMLASFIGIVSNPEMLTASDSVAVTGLNNAGIVETVVPEVTPAEPEVAPEVVTEEIAWTAAAATPVYSNYAYTPANYIAIGGNTVELAYTTSTTEDAGGATLAWYNANKRFIYGHNSWNVFRVLENVGPGSTFMVSYGGVTQNYVVRSVVAYQKKNALRFIAPDGTEPKLSELLNNNPYSLMLMTCYGEIYADGDASHRLVVYADAI